jgi:hypothetical protein
MCRKDWRGGRGRAEIVHIALVSLLGIQCQQCQHVFNVKLLCDQLQTWCQISGEFDSLCRYGFVKGIGTNDIRICLVPILLPTNSPCSSPKYQCFFWVASDQIQFCDSSLHPTTFCTTTILQCSFTTKTISYCAQNFVKQPSQFANNPS